MYSPQVEQIQLCLCGKLMSSRLYCTLFFSWYVMIQNTFRKTCLWVFDVLYIIIRMNFIKPASIVLKMIILLSLFASQNIECIHWKCSVVSYWFFFSSFVFIATTLILTRQSLLQNSLVFRYAIWLWINILRYNRGWKKYIIWYGGWKKHWNI